MWMTIDEAAKYLQVSKETLYKMAKKEQIPASKLGSQWRFSSKLIDEWLESQNRCQIEDRPEKPGIDKDHAA
jgi:excisionase family DNA binding protein